MVGLLEDVRRVIQHGFKVEGDVIALLGVTRDDMHASEYAATIEGRTTEEMIRMGRVPAIDLEKERALHETVLRATSIGLLRSAHDCSDGGLAVALAECCFSSLNRSSMGAQINLTGSLSSTAHLYSETPSRVVISFDEQNGGAIEEIAAEAGCPFTIIGRTDRDRLRIVVGDEEIINRNINELETAMLLFKSHGDPANVVACDAFLEANKAHWLVNEIRQYWKRVLKRIDVTSRTLVTLVEPGSCFVGTLAELVFAADRSYMLIGSRQGDNRPAPQITLSAMNFGPYPMSHGITRLQSRFQADPSDLERARGSIGKALDAGEAEALGLVTFALDDIDWDDEIRVFFEERASFSPDSLTGMEANLRFVGPETMESKIFARLTAWQNWIFQRPNAVGEDGALRRYGTGERPRFDMTRV